jgi:GNAT superfamily N-acetyltransferase
MLVALRPLSPADLDGIVAIEAVSYAPELFESRAALESRLAVFPDGCWIAAAGADIAGYLVSHPWVRGSVPSLDTPLGPLPDACDCYYVHDICVHPEWRKRGVGALLLTRALQTAARLSLDVTCLTAVQQSPVYWRRFGFEEWPDPTPTLREHLASYGAGAVYMWNARR